MVAKIGGLYIVIKKVKVCFLFLQIKMNKKSVRNVIQRKNKKIRKKIMETTL